ncbi:MAG TPA: hypothetical protein VHH09_08185 [Acidimicrobiales bacterium]|nr:hypothetical protein [Acidimicrobiales bacterium]
MSQPGARAAGVLLALVCLAVAGCGGEDADKTAPSTTQPPATSTPATGGAAGTTAPAGRAAGLACDSQELLRVMRDQGAQFALSPAVLAALRPEGPPQCDASFARQAFAGPPEDPGPHDALFGVRPDRSGWGLVSVNCLSSEASGQRQVC